MMKFLLKKLSILKRINLAYLILKAWSLYLKMLIAGPFMGDIGSLHDAQTAAALDNKQNMEQREQYYATVRKPLRSPIHEMATLEKIPGEISRPTCINEIKLVLFVKNR